jgi:hypothetical protein
MAAADRPNAERIGAASVSADRYFCWQGERMVFSCG